MFGFRRCSITVDEECRVVKATSAFQQKISKVGKFVGVPLGDLVRDTDRANFEGWWAEDRRNGKQITLRLISCSEAVSFPKFVPCTLKQPLRGSDRGVTLHAKAVRVGKDAATDDHYRTMLDYVQNAPIGLQWLSASGHVLWANRTQLEVLQYTAENFVGKHITDISCDPPEILTEIKNNGGVVRDLASDWKTSTGDIRKVLIDSNIRFGEDGSIQNTRCFVRDNTALLIKRAVVEIERKLQLEKTTAQDRFLRKVLHEVKTPCNNMLQSLDAGSEHDIFILQQVQKLTSIIQDVDDADAFENGQVLQQNPTKFHLMNTLRVVFRSVVGNYASQAVEKTIVVSGDRVPLCVWCDQHCMKRVITHLLDNALRFTQRGYVRLCVSCDERGRFTLAVHNTGSSLNIDFLYGVCQKYWYNQSNGYGKDEHLFSNAEAGIGLGLNICYNVVQCMGSTLTCSSRDGVNIFEFSLSGCNEFMSATEYRLQDARECRGDTGEQPTEVTGAWIDVQDSLEATYHITDAVAEIPEDTSLMSLKRNQAPGRLHVLVVDDNLICQKVLCKTLTKLACTSAVAGDGSAAVELVKTQQFDLVICDLRMPVMDGLEAARIIRRKLGNKVPIVGFSADSTRAVREECKEVGMNGFLAKPATQQQIAEVLRTYA